MTAPLNFQEVSRLQLPVIIVDTWRYNSYYYITFKMENDMEITTKGIITIKISLNKSNHYYLFHLSPKKTVCRLLIEVFMHHLCKKLSWMWISKVYAWHRNSAMRQVWYCQKDVSITFTKTLSSFGDVIKIVFSETLFPRSPLYKCRKSSQYDKPL